MAEQEKNQLGDGSDNYAGAAKQAANAAKTAKEAGKTAAKETAKKGAEATSRAAAATVKASVEGGKAAAQIAAGTAAGGPVGAAISIAWSMRHTLFKILICVCLSLTFLIVMIVSLPSIIMDSIFGTNGTQPVEGVTITSVYDSLVVDVSNAVENGYNTSMSKVENIIRNGGYDYETSMAATINYAQSSAGYDVSYILSAYSASLQQKNTSKDDMINKLNAVADKMFPVDSIIISAMLGTSFVGFLSYYKMIANNVDSIFGQILEAIKPSVGNLAASENSERQYAVFKKLCFLSFAIGNFISVSLITLLNPFIALWLGNDYLLDMSIVVMLVADVYIITMVRPYESFRNANALFIQGKYRPAIMVILNIVLSIALANKWGVSGVLFATVVSRLLTHVWYDPWLIYRKVFHKPFSNYIKIKVLYLLIVVANCGLVYVVCSIISFSNQWVEFCLKALLCAFIPNIILITLFRNNNEFKALYVYTNNLFKRKIK